MSATNDFFSYGCPSLITPSRYLITEQCHNNIAIMLKWHYDNIVHEGQNNIHQVREIWSHLELGGISVKRIIFHMNMTNVLGPGRMFWDWDECSAWQFWFAGKWIESIPGKWDDNSPCQFFSWKETDANPRNFWQRPKWRSKQARDQISQQNSNS